MDTNPPTNPFSHLPFFHLYSLFIDTWRVLGKGSTGKHNHRLRLSILFSLIRGWAGGAGLHQHRLSILFSLIRLGRYEGRCTRIRYRLSILFSLIPRGFRAFWAAEPRISWLGLGTCRNRRSAYKAVSYTHLTLPTKRIV